MRKLGISIYPQHSDDQTIYQYIETMSKLGFSRIFTCLLSVTESKEAVLARFGGIHRFAKELGYEIICDVNPQVFTKFQISFDDLSFFKELQVDGIRLDMGFNGMQEAMLSYHDAGLKIEINMSQDTHMINCIMDFKPNRHNILGCHNFYPHNHTGLTLDFFRKTSLRFRNYGLTTAAFIGSQEKNSFGPWPTTEGLPTLEMHRDKPLVAQLKHMIVLDCVDDVLISNCYPSEEELIGLKDLDIHQVVFDMVLAENLPDVQRDIVLKEQHIYRGDDNPHVIRSSGTRVKYKNHPIVPFHTTDTIRPGDILIDNELYQNYAGECQIAKSEFQNNGKINVVGHICEDELFILYDLTPWQKFRFRLR